MQHGDRRSLLAVALLEMAHSLVTLQMPVHQPDGVAITGCRDGWGVRYGERAGGDEQRQAENGNGRKETSF